MCAVSVTRLRHAVHRLAVWLHCWYRRYTYVGAVRFATATPSFYRVVTEHNRQGLINMAWCTSNNQESVLCWQHWPDFGPVLAYIVVCFFNPQWWCRYEMKPLSALLALCEWNPPVISGFLSQRTSNTGSNVWFDVSLKQMVGQAVELSVLWGATALIVT